MGFIEIFLVGVGLSMDAFAVSVCKGLGMARVNYRHAIVIALFFGAFQAAMPFVGWALGSQFAAFVEPVDHWIAFALLAIVGGKMLWDAFHEEDDECPSCDGDAGQRLDYKELVMLAVATSIDALAVGIGFAFLQINIIEAVSIIGVTTFALSFAGVALGVQFGARFRRPSTVLGGVVLILIGFKILLEHLGILVL